jgi:hypothetical protein
MAQGKHYWGVRLRDKFDAKVAGRQAGGGAEAAGEGTDGEGGGRERGGTGDDKWAVEGGKEKKGVRE